MDGRTIASRRYVLNNFIHYGDWTISWEIAGTTGWTFYIEFLPPRGKSEKLDWLKTEVGFFRDLDRGKMICEHLIDLSVIKIRLSVVNLAAQYSRNRHDRDRAIREILGRDEELKAYFENSVEGKDIETP